MDFGNNYYGVLFELFGIKFYITDTLIGTWAVMAILIIFAIVVRIRLKKFTDVPNGFQNVVELMVESMDNFTVSSMGQEFRSFGGFFFSMFAFIICSNYISLLGLRPPTADLATTAVLALTIFAVTQGVGLTRRPKGYLKSFVEPNVIFLPINLIGEVSNTLSLCFRLFGNMLGSVIILGLVYNLLPVFLRIGIPVPLHAYFDLFAGALQAFIFTVLSMTFMRQKGVEDA